MLLMLAGLFALLFILSGSAAVVEHNKLRESRRRQARSLSLALAASESCRQYVGQFRTSFWCSETTYGISSLTSL